LNDGRASADVWVNSPSIPASASREQGEYEKAAENFTRRLPIDPQNGRAL
jgi:hypothetical protein